MNNSQFPQQPTSDAEALVSGFLPSVRAAYFNIAPERANDLNVVLGGPPWIMDFTAGSANFAAHVAEPSVEARYSALLSLWAVAKAALQISQAMADASRRNEKSVIFTPGTPEHEGRYLLDLARKLIRDADFSWPADAPRPDPTAAAGSPEDAINNVFLGASGWCVLHEVAHVHLKHQGANSPHLMLQQEFDADDWATRWVLEKCPNDTLRQFRVVCCAVGLVWIGIVDSIRRGSVDHPHASERLMKCADHFRLSDLSPAIEIANHILKAFFNPDDELPIGDDPGSAFRETMFAYLRNPR